MKTRSATIYICEVCGFESEFEMLVKQCEQAELPARPRVEPGDEVRLDARDLRQGYRFVRAVVTRVRVERFDDGVFVKHEWVLDLDRQVMLGSKWEDYLQTVPASWMLTLEKCEALRMPLEQWRELT